MAGQTYVIDLDGTLLRSDRSIMKACSACGRVRYPVTEVNRELVAAVNKLYAEGNTIIIWTSRAWDLYHVTVAQLRQMGIHYMELFMGKPAGIYVDVDALRSLP